MTIAHVDICVIPTLISRNIIVIAFPAFCDAIISLDCYARDCDGKVTSALTILLTHPSLEQGEANPAPDNFKSILLKWNTSVLAWYM